MHQAILLAVLASAASGAVIPSDHIPKDTTISRLWQRNPANLPWAGWFPPWFGPPATPSVTTSSVTRPTSVATSTLPMRTSTSLSNPSVSVSTPVASVSTRPISVSISASLSASVSASVSVSVTVSAGASATLPPKVKSSTYIANVTDPNLDRDSCTSARIGGQILWSCRDTQVWNTATNQDVLPLIQNTAGWTKWSAVTGPVITPGSQAPQGCASTGNNSIYQMYGQTTGNPVPYYPLASDMCPSNGLCSDNSRWVYWPDSPPLMTTTQTLASTSATGYSWVEKKHISGLSVVNTNPPTTLFKTTWSGGSALPSVSVVQDQFWAQGEVSFGNYGNVINNGYAYLYGQNTASSTLLARVPVGSIENRSAYQYWYQGNWSTTMPSKANTDSTIPNAGAGGQGTFYYSSYYGAYLWIGQALYDTSANFYLSYATQPQGPWSQRQLIFQGQNAANSQFGAYSLQAHPALLPSSTASEAGIYLTWTIPNNANNSATGSFITPLVYLQFQ